MNRTTAVHAPAPRGTHVARATSHMTLGRRRRVLTRAAESERARVAAAFRALAHGVDAPTAAARTNEFYHSSGFSWARSLG